MKVKLNSARCGHKFDSKGRFIGVFAEYAGQEVDMPNDEAQRYIERGLAQQVDSNSNQKK